MNLGGFTFSFKAKEAGHNMPPSLHEAPCLELPGLGRPSTSRALWDIVKTIDLVGIFLMETMIDFESVSHVLKLVGFSFFISVPSVGRRGSLLFCWRSEFRFSLLAQSRNFFHLEVDLMEKIQFSFVLLFMGRPLGRKNLPSGVICSS